MRTKRVISLVLAAVLVLSMVPALQLEAKAENTDVYALVEQQIQAYAKSIDQKDAAKTAATALLTNAAFRGKDLTFDESSAMTAMIFNSYLFQLALTHSCTEMFKAMHQPHSKFLTVNGGVGWNSQNANYYLYGYEADQLCAVAFANSPKYLGNYNRNDKMLISVAGHLQLDYTITTVEIRKDTAVYKIDVRVYDNFDFDGDYSSSDGNAEYEELLSMFGALTLRKFSWECLTSFGIEVPHACDHPNNAIEETLVTPTCSTQGYTAHTCTKCGYSYQTDYVDKLPHDFQDTVVAPSCTAEGYTNHTCKDCGFSHNTDTVPMLPHSYGNYASNHDATCAHDGTKTGKCIVCGARDTVVDEGSALPHTWAEATCKKAKTCLICGSTEGDPLGHDLMYGDAKPPTCTRVGWDAYEKCQRCSHSTFLVKPALGHDYVNGFCTRCNDWDGTVILGDVNSDGRIDTADAYQIVLYYNEKIDLTEAQLAAADVNRDGTVDTTDAYRIVLFYNEKIDSLI